MTDPMTSDAPSLAPPTSSHGSRSVAPGRVLPLLVAVVAVVVSAVAVLRSGHATTEPSAHQLSSSVPANAYAAVTLNNNSVYFGHLRDHDGVLELDEVYYVDPQTRNLVRRGSELFGPTGVMVLLPTQILQIEQVGASSEVGKGIEKIRAQRGDK